MAGETTKRTVSVSPVTLAVWFACLIGVSVSAAFLVGYAIYKKQSDDKDRLVLAVEKNNKFLSDKNIELQHSLQKLEDLHGNLESRYLELAASLGPPQHRAAATTNNLPRGLPPVEQSLVREGEFAVNLATAFNLSSSRDEVTAESYLASINIMPRNGWISDYPMTPDIIAEVRESAAISASSGYLQISETDAVGLVDNISLAMNLPVASYDPASGSRSGATSPAQEASQFVEPSVVEDYYDDNKPPVITYYPPPLDYAYLYDWVPSPFWWDGFAFRGFFILVDFERRHHHHCITNHVTNANGTVSKIKATTRASATANRQIGSSADIVNTGGSAASFSGSAPDTDKTIGGQDSAARDMRKLISSPRPNPNAAPRSTNRDARTFNSTPLPHFPPGNGGYSSGYGDRPRIDSGMGGSHSSGLGSSGGGHR